ncbi:MAG: carbohydrate ABC transporter substrate-binding protein [Ruminococcus sp.]|nr:carbohydrate ABC transporter substrate-binding protein [Ruminococcus sp.]
MRYFKLFFSIILVISIMLSFPSCSKESRDGSENIYVYDETKLVLPQEFSRVIDMCVIKSGELRIAVTNSCNDVSIFDSSDNGNSWDLVCDVSKSLDLNEDSYTNIILSDENHFFCESCENIKNNEDVFTSEKKYYYFNNNENTIVKINLDDIKSDDFVEEYDDIISNQNIDIRNGITSGSFTQDGNLLISDYLGKGYLFDTTSWKKISEYEISEEMNQVEDICNYEDYTIAVSYAGSLFYDYLNGNISDESKLEENITDVISDALKITTISGNYLFIRNGVLYFFNSCGLYKYSENEWEKINECNGTFIGKTGTRVTSFSVFDENKYYVCVTDTITNNSEIYTYSKTKLDRSKNTLTIWSLKESTAIERAINVYKSLNNSMTVNYEIGTGEDGAITVKDAISNLNTKLLANDGPDIIMLDQISIDTYINNEYLLDISDVIKELTESDKLFDNLANAYNKNGKIYAIPSRFAIMIVEGDKKTVENASNISSLISYAEQLKSDNSKVSVFEEDNFEYVAEYMYNASVSTLINNGEINRSAIKKFCSDIQKLHTIYNNPNVLFEESIDNVFVGTDYYSLADDSLQIGTDYVSSYGYQFSGINALRKYNNDYNYALMNSSAGNIYLPMNIAGINSNSSNKEMAKEFIRTLLSENVQTLAENDGAEPVNKVAFKSDLNGDYNIDMGSLKLKSLTDDEKSKLIALTESLDTPVNRDITIKNTIFEQLESCFNGSILLDEAEENIINKLELYLNE